MKKVLITGGSGAVGAAFIETYYDKYRFVSLSRNEEKQMILKQRFNKIETFIGSIEDRTDLVNHFLKIKPDIVIHAAALKRIEIAEKQPIQTIKINILGSLNVIEASRIANVPITIGISSDKACLSNSVYGHTKNLMERIFLEAADDNNRFACCRLGNVVGSQGSVIPFWLKLAKDNQALKITSIDMNRFMFLPSETAYLLQKAIETLKEKRNPFVLTKKVKPVNVFDIAKHISSRVEVVGKRPGEKLNENLISVNELPFTYLDEEYIYIKTEKNQDKKNRLQKSLNSFREEKMNSSDIKNLIKNVESMHEKNFN